MTIKKSKNTASALLLVLAVIALLSTILIITAKMSRIDVDSVLTEKNSMIADNLAHYAIAIASHSKIETDNPNLFGEINGGKYTSTISSHEKKIPINNFLAANEQQILSRLFILWGASENEANIASASLIDWYDKDDESEPNGAESTHYNKLNFENLPKNDKFINLNEMKLVRGMQKIIEINENWKDSFSILDYDKIDAKDIDKITLAAVADINETTANNFENWRNGRDGKKNTEDDVVIESLDEIFSTIGISTNDPNTEIIKGLLKVKSNYKQIDGYGEYKKIKSHWTMILKEKEIMQYYQNSN